ncbi:hypothetical protein EKO23_23810 [Nocardioides guangzhouensis]|uniref:Uncharacterized protein n=1 Tax=Nocardioides guangzhouensis TaxID=2497878 RepID=A0A4Q4Z373_9ACTN|nr:hypothetical protein [Nocardioides guangzhouensis]RYP81284.1 hypothetical protein EKO23_23810 [Nocardioides guangzhouensis]
MIVQISPGEGSAHDALLAGLSSGAVYRRDEVFVWLAEWDEVNVTEIGSASMYPAFADPIPIWQVSATFASPTRPGRR